MIRRTDIIGDHVQAYQAVTLGAQSFSPDEKGNIVKEELRCPIIEEDVTIRSVKGATPKC